MTFDAIYENGVFRPIEHIDLAEHQVVRVTIRDYPLQTSNPGAKRLNDMIDWEYMDDCKKHVSGQPIPTLEEVHQALSKIPGSLADDLAAERELR